MDEQSTKIIRTHSLWAMGAGLLPLPLVDIAAVSAIQVDLLNALARRHGIPVTDTNGKAVVTALAGSTLARFGASVVKAVPGVGSVVGGLSMSAMAGASTYAIGSVAVAQIEKHGTLFDIDVRWARAQYDEAYAEGRRVAEELKDQEDAAKRAFEKLERLGALRDSGVITEEEFQAKKAALLEQIA